MFSRNSLPKTIKDRAYVINLEEHADVGTHWTALFCNRNEIVCFDRVGVEHVPEENKEIDRTSSTNETRFRLDEISKIENYFYQEINQRKSCRKKLSKDVVVFDYIDQALIVLSATNGGVSLISFTSIVGAPAGIASASLTLFFSLTTVIVKKLLNITRNKKKKNDKILMLPKNRLNSIETLIFISQALIDIEISHEEFIAILKEKDKYEKMKDNLISQNEKYI